jgi:hypothetical protein
MRFHEDITEILLKVVLNPSNKQTINYNPVEKYAQNGVTEIPSRDHILI